MERGKNKGRMNKMDGWIDRSMNEWMDGWINGWTDG